MWGRYGPAVAAQIRVAGIDGRLNDLLLGGDDECGARRAHSTNLIASPPFPAGSGPGRR
jgi:hypothetical protein